MNQSETIYYSSRLFGDLKSIGDFNNDFVDRSLSAKVFLLARSHLCPVPEEVVKNYSQAFSSLHPEVTNPEQITIAGQEATIKRYFECNFNLKSVLILAEKNNPELYFNLITPISRFPGEFPDQSLNPKYLPLDFNDKMNLASTPYGYAIPRIIIAQFGENASQKNKSRIFNGLQLIDQLIPKYYDPIVFTVKLADGVSRLDADPEKVLYQLLSLDFLHEEGCKTLYNITLNTLQKRAPFLANIYQKNLTEKGETGLHKMGIIAPSDLK